MPHGDTDGCDTEPRRDAVPLLLPIPVTVHRLPGEPLQIDHGEFQLINPKKRSRLAYSCLGARLIVDAPNQRRTIAAFGPAQCHLYRLPDFIPLAGQWIIPRTSAWDLWLAFPVHNLHPAEPQEAWRVAATFNLDGRTQHAVSKIEIVEEHGEEW